MQTHVLFGQHQAKSMGLHQLEQRLRLASVEAERRTEMEDFVLEDRKTAAEYLKIKPQTLAVWAVKGIGPAPTKIGSRVFYRRDILEAYVIGQTAPRKA